MRGSYNNTQANKNNFYQELNYSIEKLRCNTEDINVDQKGVNPKNLDGVLFDTNTNSPNKLEKTEKSSNVCSTCSKIYKPNLNYPFSVKISKSCRKNNKNELPMNLCDTSTYMQPNQTQRKKADLVNVSFGVTEEELLYAQLRHKLDISDQKRDLYRQNASNRYKDTSIKAFEILDQFRNQMHMADNLENTGNILVENKNLALNTEENQEENALNGICNHHDDYNYKQDYTPKYDHHSTEKSVNITMKNNNKKLRYSPILNKKLKTKQLEKDQRLSTLTDEKKSLSRNQIINSTPSRENSTTKPLGNTIDSYDFENINTENSMNAKDYHAMMEHEYKLRQIESYGGARRKGVNPYSYTGATLAKKRKVFGYSGKQDLEKTQLRKPAVNYHVTRKKINLNSIVESNEKKHNVMQSIANISKYSNLKRFLNISPDNRPQEQEYQKNNIFSYNSQNHDSQNDLATNIYTQPKSKKNINNDIKTKFDNTGWEKHRNSQSEKKRPREAYMENYFKTEYQENLAGRNIV